MEETHDIPLLSAGWRFRDYLGAFMVRSGIGRSRYRVRPGLYKSGSPSPASPVLVTANYKLTVDRLRKNIGGLDSWILVLDTKGVNVWCAAGKGTFGTGELVRSIRAAGLEDHVNHKTIILPQLGAPGIDPREIRKETGFIVKYGPVESRDIPKFMESGMKADPSMRRKQFPIGERAAVSYTHFVQGLVPSVGIGAVLGALSLLMKTSGGLGPGTVLLMYSLIAAASMLTGSVLTGILLPLLPGRAFSIKAILPAIAFAAGSFAAFTRFVHSIPALLYSGGVILLLAAWLDFQTLNLTGSSTYTSLSGVRREMTFALPALVSVVIAGAGLIIAGGILA